MFDESEQGIEGAVYIADEANHHYVGFEFLHCGDFWFLHCADFEYLHRIDFEFPHYGNSLEILAGIN